MFRKTNEESLKEVIEQLLETYKLRDKLNQVKLQRSWDEIMGEMISKRTEKLILKDHTLYIYLNLFIQEFGLTNLYKLILIIIYITFTLII